MQRSSNKRGSYLVPLALLAGAALTTRSAHQWARARRRWLPPSGEDVRTSVLTARVLGGEGPPIMLLHGLVASGIYWGAAYDRLADGHRLVVPDLLGFGRSSRPAGGYGPDDHANAVISCLDELGIREPTIIGAHSLGTLVALRLATTHPDRVRAIVAFGPPLYADPAMARAHVTATSPMARLLVLPGAAAEAVCEWVCRHRSIAGRLAALTHPSLPAPIATDSVQHSWESYSQTLALVLLPAEAATWLDDAQCSVRLVAGSDDPVVDEEFLVELAAAHPQVVVELWDGGHDLPISRARDCVDLIRQIARST